MKTPELSDKKVIVAMSGGVDSSVAAALLVERGFDVTGVAMRVYSAAKDSPPEQAQSGNALDFADAFAVAEKLGIQFFIKDFRRQFKAEVIDPFVAEYLKGRTPNPCVICNNRLKFYHLFEIADIRGAKFVASGHYARIKAAPDNTLRLYKGLDSRKDQSYFLFGLKQRQLGRIQLPVGEFTKDEIRKKAAELGFDNASKRESQEICFIADNRTGDFIANYSGRGETEGEILNTAGEVIGRHKGIMHYTVGQRSGMGIAHSTPLYVLKINPAQNTIVAGENEELDTDTVSASGFSSPSGVLPARGETVTAKVRYRHKGADAVIEEITETGLRLRFTKPVRAVTPGQALVIYRNDECLGGAWID